MDAIELRPSRRLGLWLAAGTGLALVAIARAALPAAIQGLLVAAVVAVAVRGWLRTRVVTVLRIGTTGGLQVRSDAGEWEAVEVEGDTFVTATLIVLRYRLPERGVETRIILPDSAPADTIRRLRVSLRWAPRTRSDTAFPDAG